LESFSTENRALEASLRVHSELFPVENYQKLFSQYKKHYSVAVRGIDRRQPFFRISRQLFLQQKIKYVKSKLDLAKFLPSNDD